MKQAGRTATGEWKAIEEGGFAFHPDPLPPKIEWDVALVSALSRADIEIGKLTGEAKRLPNPHVLIRPYARREAVYSSKIEGTQATLGEILAVEAGAKVERSPDDIREVNNYVQALEYGLERVHALPISKRLILELHEILMQGVRGDHAHPGKFRTIQNWIGPLGCSIKNASFVPPPPQHLQDCLNEWERYVHEGDLPVLLHAALIHYQFETIHPFLDGNGRIGRLLITLLLIERGIMDGPFLYLSASFEANRTQYYQCLREVSENGDWKQWFLFFLNAVEHQAGDAMKRSQLINAQLDEWRNQLHGKRPVILPRILDLIATNPYLTARKVQSALEVAYNTASKAIQVLQSEDILIPVDDRQRDRVYVSSRLLEILEDPL
ncbi:MAG: Fic family protein [Puniceicoccaceae bacterium]